MLNYAIGFFVAVLGFSGLAGAAAGIAKILFYGFLILAIVSFIFGKRKK